MKNLYYFLTECLFFGKPKEGSIIPKANPNDSILDLINGTRAKLQTNLKEAEALIDKSSKRLKTLDSIEKEIEKRDILETMKDLTLLLDSMDNEGIAEKVEEFHENTSKQGVDYEDGTFGDKTDLLCLKYKHCFKSPDLVNWIIKAEGRTNGNKTSANISQKLKNLVDLGRLSVGKIGNSNRYSFFFLPDWIKFDNKTKTARIIGEYGPKMSELRKVLSKEQLENSVIKIKGKTYKLIL